MQTILSAFVKWVRTFCTQFLKWFKMALQNAIGFFEFQTQPVTFDDWFLPSKDGLNAMRTELYLYGVGGFINIGDPYWSSSEVFGSVANAWVQAFSDGAQGTNTKTTSICHVRACRSFTSIINYNLRDIGLAGGRIFWKSGNDYLEAAL